MSQEVLATAIPPELKFVQCLLLWSIYVLGTVNVECRSRFACTTAGCKAGLVGTPLVGDDVSTIHTTDGKDHVVGACLILVKGRKSNL